MTMRRGARRRDLVGRMSDRLTSSASRPPSGFRDHLDGRLADDPRSPRPVDQAHRYAMELLDEMPTVYPGVGPGEDRLHELYDQLVTALTARLRDLYSASGLHRDDCVFDHGIGEEAFAQFLHSSLSGRLVRCIDRKSDGLADPHTLDPNAEVLALLDPRTCFISSRSHCSMAATCG